MGALIIVILEGNIQFIKAPTPSELIIAYYGTVHNIELYEVNKTEDSNLNKSYYVAKVKTNDLEKMKTLGWILLVFNIIGLFVSMYTLQAKFSIAYLSVRGLLIAQIVYIAKTLNFLQRYEMTRERLESP